MAICSICPSFGRALQFLDQGQELLQLLRLQPLGEAGALWFGLLVAHRAEKANGIRDRREIGCCGIDLLDEDEPLLIIFLDGKGGSGMGGECGMASLGNELHIQGRDVPATDDDELLHPTGDEELTLMEEAEVPRAQERSGEGLARALGILQSGVAMVLIE